jgi:predicted nucleic acid-binding protein
VAAAHPSIGLIDTDILIDQTRGVPAAATFLSVQHAAGSVFVSIVSAMELIQGCRNAVELGNVRRLLGTMTVLPLTDTISGTALHLMDALFLSHGLRIPDALIAATALDHDMPLYTKNLRHLQAVPSLTTIRPY